MKITTTKDNLLNALKKANSAIGNRPITPVISNVKLEAKGDRLILSATDNEIHIITWINVLVEEEGVTTLPAKKMLQLISVLNTGDVTLESNDNHITTISSQKTVYKINGLPADDFPSIGEDGMNAFQAELSFEMKLADFIRGISKVAYAKSADDNHKLLNGVDLSIHGDLLSVVATDGRRLAMMEYTLPDLKMQDGDYVIPSKASTELVKCLDMDDEFVKIQISNKMMSFSTKNTILITKTVEGSYPNFRKVIPETSEFSISVSRQLFINVVSRVSLIVMDNAGSIKLNFKRGLMTVYASHVDTGEASETVEVDYESDEELTIALNPHFFLDPLKIMEADQVNMKFGKQYNAVKLLGENGFLYMLMPMRA